MATRDVASCVGDEILLGWKDSCIEVKRAGRGGLFCLDNYYDMAT